MRRANGWDRGTVDEMGFYDADDVSSWIGWAESVADAMPEASLLQLMALSVRGTLDGREAFAAEESE
jgi:hypothetical protein